MRAAVRSRYGPPEVIEVTEVENPVPKANEVLIRIHATTVCAADWRLRKADPFMARFFSGLLRPKQVRILGMEFSGTIASLGSDVTRFQVGDEVFGSPLLKFGTHAEYVCMPADGLIEKRPANMPLDECAAVLFGGLTVLGFLGRAKINPGDKGVYPVHLHQWRFSDCKFSRLNAVKVVTSRLLFLLKNNPSKRLRTTGARTGAPGLSTCNLSRCEWPLLKPP